MANSKGLAVLFATHNSPFAVSKESCLKRKKSRAISPALKIVSTLFSRKVGFDLIGGATLLVRARVPPETWTTRLQPLGQPELGLIDLLFRLVTIFSNDCSKFKQFSK
jgi:hypothetical protein